MFSEILKDSKGQEVLEFVIILPVLLFVVVLLLTYGKVVYVRMTAELAAREAARTYAVYSNQDYGSFTLLEKARQAAANNLSGVLPVKKEYFDAVNDVNVSDVSLVGKNTVPDPNGEYCKAEVQVRVPIEAPFFRRLLGKPTVGSDWNKAFGKRKGTEYVVEVRGDAVFKKEPKIEEGNIGQPGT